VTANPFRFVIVAVLAIAGVLVIGNAFDGTSTQAQSVASPAPAPSKTVRPKHEKTHTPKPASPSPSEPAATIDGVRIEVFNATTTTGLAASVQSKLEKRNATPAGDPGNAATVATTTTLYYRDAKTDKPSAEYIANRFFSGADVKPISQLPTVTVNGATVEVSKDVQVAIVVGEDYQP
jgi:hypothetical protein